MNGDVESGRERGSGGQVTMESIQTLLTQSYSEQADDQQQAAIALAKLVENNIFPASSFGPLSHAICKLIPSKNRTVVCYAAKALKCLILDDALRPQVVVAGVPIIVCEALKKWVDEILCLRELLGALQTLCWDKQCLKSVLQVTDVVSDLVQFTRSLDQEVSVLSLTCVANIFSFSDSLLLSNTLLLEVLGTVLPSLIEIVRILQKHQPQRFYAMAAIANASAHPRLASILNQNGGLQLCREIERQSLANLNIFGSRMGDCANTALCHLSEKREGDANFAMTRYRFKYGNKPVMELSLVSYGKYGGVMWICLGAWLFIVLFVFWPLKVIW